MAEVIEEPRIQLVTADGSFHASIFRPAAPGPSPVVLLCADTHAQEPGVSLLVRSLAYGGYYVVVRDLDAGAVASGSGPTQPWVVDVRRVARETHALVTHIDADPAAMATEMGAIGFGAGGAYAVAAAVQEPARVKAVATINGRQLVTDREDSPHRLVRLVAAEMYFGFSRHDDLPSTDEFTRLARALEDCAAPYGVDRTLDIAPGFGARAMNGPRVAIERDEPCGLLLSLLGRRLPRAQGGRIACEPAQA